MAGSGKLAVNNEGTRVIGAGGQPAGREEVGQRLPHHRRSYEIDPSTDEVTVEKQVYLV
ncbi:hypothetical protein OROMI_010408 [Orobanche minor]